MNYHTIQGAADIRFHMDDELLATVESGVYDQARNTASLPGVKQVSILPDTHSGFGAPIGSVVATTGTVIPGPVGYDIGCFTGDTLVPLVDGKSYPMAQLVEMGEFFVYALSEQHMVQVAKATAKRTRVNASLIRVTLDNGRILTCTPDHEFMLRDGSYRQARELTEGTSLMPLYLRSSKGYPAVLHPATGRYQVVHWVMARQGMLGPIPKFEGQKTVIHHKDFNPTNNQPDNHVFMGDKDHMSFHHEHGVHGWQLKTPEFEAKRVAGLRAMAETPEGHKFLAERGTRNLQKYTRERPEHFQAAVANNGERGKEYLEAYNTSDRGRAKSKELSNKLYPCDICDVEIKSWIGVHNHKKRVHQCNHKVVSVEYLNETADVYCLTVPDYGNFALDAGVFVHNCGMQVIKTNLKAEDVKDRETRRALMDAICSRVAMGEGQDALHGIKLDDKVIMDVVNDGSLALTRRGIVPKPWSVLCERAVHMMPDNQTFEMSEVPDRARRGFQQLGTLGGGNHFLELQTVTVNPGMAQLAKDWGLFDGQVVIMLHSGSRGFGHALGQWAFDNFRAYNDSLKMPYPDKELVYAPVSSPVGHQYMRYIAAGANFALANRLVMASVIKEAVERHFPGTKVDLFYEISHNLAQWEPVEGDRVLVHRKGTTRALPANHELLAGTPWETTGHPVITPGSMGDISAIQVGRPENQASLHSINHGAGRKMSRSQARKHLDQAEVNQQMSALDVLVNHRDVPLDEAPAAYKPMEDVLRAVRHCKLADTVATCKPLASMKGGEHKRR